MEKYLVKKIVCEDVEIPVVDDQGNEVEMTKQEIKEQIVELYPSLANATVVVENGIATFVQPAGEKGNIK